MNENNVGQNTPGTEKGKQKLSVGIHFMCGWPLLLVLFGGAIGGGLGGLAYGINLGIYKAEFPTFLKVFLNPLVGGAAIAIWFAIAKAFFVSQ